MIKWYDHFLTHFLLSQHLLGGKILTKFIIRKNQISLKENYQLTERQISFPKQMILCKHDECWWKSYNHDGLGCCFCSIFYLRKLIQAWMGKICNHLRPHACTHHIKNAHVVCCMPKKLCFMLYRLKKYYLLVECQQHFI